MARFYVEKDGEWNIFSTVVDDFLLDEFVCLDALKARLLYERYKELIEDIDSLLTDRPKVNVMTYEEAVEQIRKDEPHYDAEEVAKDINRRVDMVKKEWSARHIEDEPQKWETPPKFEHKGDVTTCVNVPVFLIKDALIEDEQQTERSE